MQMDVGFIKEFFLQLDFCSNLKKSKPMVQTLLKNLIGIFNMFFSNYNSLITQNGCFFIAKHTQHVFHFCFLQRFLRGPQFQYFIMFYLLIVVCKLYILNQSLTIFLGNHDILSETIVFVTIGQCILISGECYLMSGEQ